MNNISKTLVGTVAAGAMAMTSAAPAFARDRDDGISAGEIIAGAVIIGGIAAIASAASKDRGYDRNYNDGYRYNARDNRGGYNDYYGRGNPRAAVEQCVRVAELNAQRAGYRFANVTDIRDVDDKRYGWRVKGRIDVQGQRGYGDRYDRYDRGRRADSGSFTCDISRGRVVGLDYSGVRGLR
ncbi:hypothetical protein [Allopontixanthobacter sediminis]|uniref:Uncharacterized protein n=1 Tax=Allopontixanthobacter sediminis TaxID=1689985 RepID=A0A845B1K5_9SPHN|nr:hypothetical protein [Allopontixanthobacter sediminis]MXP43307.1 hypothetical protein [Allopontixanthobacter sediminis]